MADCSFAADVRRILLYCGHRQKARITIFHPNKMLELQKGINQESINRALFCQTATGNGQNGTDNYLERISGVKRKLQEAKAAANNAKRATPESQQVLIEDDLPLSMIAEDLNLRAAQTNKSLQEELKETLRASKSPFARISTSTSLDKLESTIKKEMDLFECREQGGDFCSLHIIASPRCCQPALSRRGHSQQRGTLQRTLDAV
ncbi:hypothetical protein ACJJTC_010471 [Scirpophaga incertulas]